MKVKSKRKLIIVLVSAILISLTLSFFMQSVSVFALEWVGGEIADEYSYGEEFTVPNRTVEKDGVSYGATFSTVMPSGKVSSERTFTLDESGIYKVNYTAEIGSERVTDTAEFVVKIPVAKTGSKSSYYYGSHKKAEDKKGLVATIADGEKLEFSQIIDLTNTTRHDHIAEFFVIPDVEGSLACEQFWITLTDVEDPTNFLTLRGNASDIGSGHSTTYVLAKGDGQPNMVGYNYSWNGVDKDNTYGAPIWYNMYGMDGGVYQRRGDAIMSLRLSYDSSTKGLYFTDYCGGYGLVADLDDSYYVGDTLWKGFKSGKVRMSFYGKGYASESATFVFLSLRGADLSQTSVADKVAPVIHTAEKPSYSGAVGGSFLVPSATAYDDVNGNVEVGTEVVFDKGGLNQTIEIANGRFATEREGTYTIIYSAKDYFGNIATKEMEITVGEVLSPISITLNGQTSTANRGEFMDLAKATVSGGTGKVTLSTYVTHAGNKELVDGDRYLPLYSGEYVFEYVAIDDIGVIESLSYTVNVINGDEPVFRDEPKLPRYFISGFNYTVPALYAYDYSTGTEKKVEAVLTVKDDYSEKTVGTNSAFTPLVKANLNETLLTWKAGETILTRRVKTIQAIGSNGIFIENYFVSDGVSVSKTNDDVRFTANEENGKVEFANDLLSEKFNISLNAVVGKSNFNGVKITLKDVEKVENSISVTIKPNGDLSRVEIFDNYGDISVGFTEKSASNEFLISYADGIFKVGSLSLAVKTMDNGNPFEGFKEDVVAMTIEFLGAQNGSEISVTNLSNQPIRALDSDRVYPNVSFKGLYGGCAVLGEKITVPAMISKDVLSPNVACYVNVTNPNGKVVVSDDGVTLSKVSSGREYVFTAQKEGVYRFEYVSYDSLSGRSQNFNYIVTVENKSNPTIVITCDYTKTIKVGETLIIPTFTVKDDTTEVADITVIRQIVSSTGKIYNLGKETNSMVVKNPGVYQIRIIAVDGFGNRTMETLDVIVSA